MADQDKVRGHNDAIYGPVPKNDQLLDIEFLEIAPTPIWSDRVFFVYLRGNLPEGKKNQLSLPDEGLLNATVKVGSSVVYLDGRSEEPTYTKAGPFKTQHFNDLADLSFRHADGPRRRLLA